jgi:hypothetical protein
VHLTFDWQQCYKHDALPFRWAVLQSLNVDTSSRGRGGRAKLKKPRACVEMHGKAFALANLRLLGIDLLDEYGKSAPRLAAS